MATKGLVLAVRESHYGILLLYQSIAQDGDRPRLQCKDKRATSSCGHRRPFPFNEYVSDGFPVQIAGVPPCHAALVV